MAEAYTFNQLEYRPTSSSSGVVPYGLDLLSRELPVTQPEPEPTKSSSMSPIVDEVAPVLEYTPVTTDKKKKQTSKPKDTPAKDSTPPAEPTQPEFTERFTPTVVDDDPSEFNPTTQDWFGEGAQQQPEPEPFEDPHRSLLQAIMEWDDVPYGKKWNHYLQHGMVALPSRSSENIQKMAALENKGGLAGAGATFGQELRAKETKRRTLMNQWDKLLADWNAGRYAGDEQSLNYFYGVADRLREEFAAEGINPNTLRPPSINAGGFAQGFQKSLQDDRTKLDWLGGWLESIQKHATDDPNWLNSNQAQMEFDKLSEYVILNWAQSKGAIADAEKVRAQVEAMPPQDRAVFDKFMKMYFNSNTVSQLMSLAYTGDTDAMQTIQSMNKFLGAAERGEKLSDENGLPSNNVMSWMNAAKLGLSNIARNNLNLPYDTVAAVTSYDNALDAFLNYTMQNANVDRKMVWDSASDQLKMLMGQYNDKLPKLGLQWGWGYKPRRVDASFGDYLGRWQQTQQTSPVMSNARLGSGTIPKPIVNTNPTGNAGAGAGAVVTQTPPTVPQNARLAGNYWIWTDQNGNIRRAKAQ